MTKKKLKKFEIQSSERETYEQEVCYQVKVADEAGIVGEKQEEILIEMLDSLKEQRLANYVHRKFGEQKELNLDVRVIRKGRNIIGKVIISKKSFWEKVRDALKKD